METGQTASLVCERLTGWVDMEAVCYCIGSKSGTEGKRACHRGVANGPEFLQKKPAKAIWDVPMSGMLLLCNPR